jgi:hypothetical protein
MVLVVVAVPTLVTSYRHARDVVRTAGDPVMAPWLPASMVGLLLASLGVIWGRRRSAQAVGPGPWGAFGFAMLVIVGANLAAVRQGSLLAYAVAVFPPSALVITLELAAVTTLRGGHRGRGPSQPATDTIATPEPDLADSAPTEDFPLPEEPLQCVAGTVDPGPPPATRDDAPAGPAAEPGDTPGNTVVVATAVAEPVVDAAPTDTIHTDTIHTDITHTDIVQPTNRAVATMEKPQPDSEPIASPAPPPAPAPNAARPARGSAKAPSAGKRPATARTSTSPATATPDAPTRMGTRPRPARAKLPVGSAGDAAEAAGQDSQARQIELTPPTGP